MPCRAHWIALLSLPCLAAAFEQQQVFDGQSPYGPGILRRFSPGSLDRLQDVLEMVQTQDLDIWQIHAGDEPYVDIYTPPLAAFLPSRLLDVPHTSSNVTPTGTTPEGPRSQTEEEEEWDLETLQNTTFHDEYHPHSDVDAFTRRLTELHPESVSLLELGHTAEGREMLGLKVSKPSNAAKLGFVVMGPQHAREWVATATALYFAHSLLVNASEPNSLASLLDVYDFHIIPSPNPDGYVHTWSTDRFWYKNRQIVGPGAKCIGIDMNRNWGFKWKPHSETPFFSEAKKTKKKTDKTPADPCSHWYPGHRAFEAAEVTNVANYLTKINGVGKGAGNGGIVAFVDLRSYGQMLAAPYSYKCNKLPKDAEDQMEALHGAAQAGRAVHGTGFSAGSLCELLYTAPGNIIDYVYSTAGIKYTYAAFLRDTGTYGFALPPAWIRPVGEETGQMVAYLAKFVARQRGIEM